MGTVVKIVNILQAHVKSVKQVRQSDPSKTPTLNQKHNPICLKVCFWSDDVTPPPPAAPFGILSQVDGFVKEAARRASAVQEVVQTLEAAKFPSKKKFFVEILRCIQSLFN